MWHGGLHERAKAPHDPFWSALPRYPFGSTNGHLFGSSEWHLMVTPRPEQVSPLSACARGATNGTAKRAADATAAAILIVLPACCHRRWPAHTPSRPRTGHPACSPGHQCRDSGFALPANTAGAAARTEDCPPSWGIRDTAALPGPHHRPPATTVRNRSLLLRPYTGGRGFSWHCLSCTEVCGPCDLLTSRGVALWCA